MIICDGHCDMLYVRSFKKGIQPGVTLENMGKGGISLQTCAVFSGSDELAKHAYMTGMKEVETFRYLINEEGWIQAGSPLEAVDGQPKIMLSLEGGEILEGNPERVQEFYDYGMRMLALTWNRENEIGTPAKLDDKPGIKPAGWEILHEMARLHIAADTSHLNEGGFWDLIEHHEQPPIASHSCAKSLCNHFRNLTDDQIRAMIERGGWIGINFYPTFLSEDGEADASRICDHIDHVCQLGGEKHVGLGSDFDGIEKTPTDVRNPSEVPNILNELRKRGYSESTIEDIAGKNLIEYYRRLGWE